MCNTRVKVKREFLIEKIKERLDRAQAKYDAKLKEYEGVIETQSLAVAKELTELAAAIKKDPKNTTLYADAGRFWNHGIVITLKTQAVVTSPDDNIIRRLQKSIRVLEAATDDTISVSTMDEYYDYI